MPKKDKCKKNHPPEKTDRRFLQKDNDTEYALVTKKLGNGRFSVKLNLQNNEVTGRLCGKFRHGGNKKTNFVDIDSVVLVGIRDFQENIVDIIYVYTHEEVRKMKKDNILGEEMSTQDTMNSTIDDSGFDFSEI
jgi:translation initiation factor 1A